MNHQEWLAARFEEYRPHLRMVAYRMLGSLGEADDAVQEGWLRLQRADSSGVDNLGGWLTTVVGRVCLDALRARKARPEEPLDEDVPEPAVGREDGSDPEHEAILADAVGPALLVVLDALAPAERVAFVLHDIFGVPFDEIALILERSPVAARQLASRARRRLQGAGQASNGDPVRQSPVVAAFLAASREGDFAALLALLDPEVVLRSDQAAVAIGVAAEIRGATGVAKRFQGGARAARLALVDGAPGLVWAPGRRPQVVFAFTIRNEKILAIDLIGDPERIRGLDLRFGDELRLPLHRPAPGDNR